MIAGIFPTAFAQNERLLDLTPFMDTDPEFRREDYYESALEAVEVEERLALFPYFIGFKDSLLLFALPCDTI